MLQPNGRETGPADLGQKRLAPPGLAEGDEGDVVLRRQRLREAEHLPLGAAEKRRGGEVNEAHGGPSVVPGGDSVRAGV